MCACAAASVSTTCVSVHAKGSGGERAHKTTLLTSCTHNKKISSLTEKGGSHSQIKGIYTKEIENNAIEKSKVVFETTDSRQNKMPVFHTKTIEAILDPVAQQVRYVY